MANIWLTYAWADNKNNDVDFIAQELRDQGLEVKLDRWNIEAGKRLWEQIESFIQDERESDAWLLYATPNSLGSEPCKEEFAYALDRALNRRGKSFPVIGLFPGPVEKTLIPAGIRSRLYVSTTDPDWKERIKAATEGRSPSISQSLIEPYHLRRYHEHDAHIIEVRPRAGIWYPMIIGIPLAEKVITDALFLVLPGQAGKPPVPGTFMVHIDSEGEITANGAKWWVIQPHDEATPLRSYYVVTTRHLHNRKR